jgi:hypothetical protein
MGLQGTLCPVGIVRRFALRIGVLRLDAYSLGPKRTRNRMRSIVTTLLVALVVGCAAYQSGETGLTKAERDTLQNYYASPATVERAARICLVRQLTKAEVVAHTSDTMHREMKNDSIIFYFAPSQVWTLTFDADGKALAADITGQKITRDEAKEIPNQVPEDTNSPFERVVWKEAHPPDVSLLYVVLTLPEAQTNRFDTLSRLVVKTAPDALRVAEGYRPREFNIVYHVRVSAGAQAAYGTGFSVEQIRQAVQLPEDKAVDEIRKHAWSLNDVVPAK